MNSSNFDIDYFDKEKEGRPFISTAVRSHIDDTILSILIYIPMAPYLKQSSRSPICNSALKAEQRFHSGKDFFKLHSRANGGADGSTLALQISNDFISCSVLCPLKVRLVCTDISEYQSNR